MFDLALSSTLRSSKIRLARQFAVVNQFSVGMLVNLNLHSLFPAVYHQSVKSVAVVCRCYVWDACGV